MRIDWHGFLDIIVLPERSKQESCAWLFSESPFSPFDTVHAVEVKNVGLKSHEYDLNTSFAPDKKDFAKVKKAAKESKYTRLGNVHTHVVVGTDPKGNVDMAKIELQRGPSEDDLKFARKFNDVIRGVIVVVFNKPGETGVIDSVVWHDQFGKELDLNMEAVET